VARFKNLPEPQFWLVHRCGGTTVLLCQLFCRQGRAEVGISSRTIDSARVRTSAGSRWVAGFASALGKQARSTVLLQAAQQAKDLTPMQADQLAGVGNTLKTPDAL
jgi:hypothetical protein